MKFFNFGSLNLDYVYSVPHFVRPGETLSSLKREIFVGGKGLNQSIALSRAGATVYHVGNVGKDGQILLDTLEKSKVHLNFVNTSDTPSGHAIIQVSAEGENCIILYEGANYEMTGELIDKALSFAEPCDVALLQNEINNIGLVIEKAKQKGLETILNPSPFNEKITALDFSKIDWLIINETEGKGISGKDTPEEILDTLLSKYPDMKIVLTLGKKGAVYADKNGRFEQGIIDAPVVDTTGAGDTFTGYFFTNVFEGEHPKKALLTASVASSIAISKKGASPSIPLMQEVKQKLDIL